MTNMSESVEDYLKAIYGLALSGKFVRTGALAEVVAGRTSFSERDGPTACRS